MIAEVEKAVRDADERERVLTAHQADVDEAISSVDAALSVDSYRRLSDFRERAGWTWLDGGHTCRLSDTEMHKVIDEEQGDVKTHLMVLLKPWAGLPAGQFVAATRLDSAWGEENGVCRQATAEEHATHATRSSVDSAVADTLACLAQRAPWSAGIRNAAALHTRMVDPEAVSRK